MKSDKYFREKSEKVFEKTDKLKERITRPKAEDKRSNDSMLSIEKEESF